METTRDAKRADLKKRLLDAAEAQLADKGLGGLKAREITTQAGCALGALYNAYDDLDTLVLYVNSRTLARLGDALLATQADDTAASPEKAMQALAAAYVGFALDNGRLWSALFDHRLPEGVETPDWHKQDHAVLIEVLLKPLSALRPDLDSGALTLRARTLFAAVNGVVQLSLQGRFVGVPRDQLASEVAALVSAMTRGSYIASGG